MAVYGGDDPSTFSKALGSVFLNSHLPSAVILVVDGPVSDDLKMVVNKYQDRPGMMIVRLQANQGLANALNVGLMHVKTQWVVRADADDYNHTNRFEILCSAMNDSVDLLGSSIRELDCNGDIICERRMPLQHKEISKFMRRRNPFNHMSVAFRVDLARQCGGYPRLYLREDYGLWILMFARGARMMNLSQVLVDATTGREMYERRGGFRYAQGEWALQVLLVREHVKSPFQASIDFFLRSLVFIAPRSIRRFVYENLLRHPASHKAVSKK